MITLDLIERREGMLNKEICIRCYNKNKKHPWKHRPAKDRAWNMGQVCCVEKWHGADTYHSAMISIYEVPDCCPYELEHLLKNQEKKDNE